MIFAHTQYLLFSAMVAAEIHPSQETISSDFDSFLTITTRRLDTSAPSSLTAEMHGMPSICEALLWQLGGWCFQTWGRSFLACLSVWLSVSTAPTNSLIFLIKPELTRLHDIFLPIWPDISLLQKATSGYT